MTNPDLPKYISPNQITIERHGHRTKDVDVILTRHTILEASQTPEIWKAVQGDHSKALHRGDMVNLILGDGEVVSERHPVLRTEGGSVWLGKPLRIINYEKVALWTDGTHEIIPHGMQYAIRHIKSDRFRDVTYATVEAAKNAVLQEQSTRAVA